jgi:hypothetical protein
MSLEAGIKIKGIKKIKIDPPNKRFWGAVGFRTATAIFKRTEGGKDFNNKSFKPYAPSTKKQREKKGRTTSRVNLIFTDKMLTSIFRGIRATGRGVKIRLTGGAAKKAFFIEKKGRKFFSIRVKDAEKIASRVLQWTVKNMKITRTK